MSKEQLVIELNKMRDNFLQESDDIVILLELLVNYIDDNSIGKQLNLQKALLKTNKIQ